MRKFICCPPNHKHKKKTRMALVNTSAQIIRAPSDPHNVTQQYPMNQREQDPPSIPSSTAMTLEEITSLLRCSICHEFFRDASHLEQCDHEFCSDCIYYWLQRSGTCPICRKEASPRDILPSTFTREFLTKARAEAREIQLTERSRTTEDPGCSTHFSGSDKQA